MEHQLVNETRSYPSLILTLFITIQFTIFVFGSTVHPRPNVENETDVFGDIQVKGPIKQVSLSN